MSAKLSHESKLQIAHASFQILFEFLQWFFMYIIDKL